MGTRQNTMTETERHAPSARRIVPWVTSIAVHLGLVAIGLIVTWTVIVAGERDAPERIVADFQMLEYRPVVETTVSTLEAVVAAPMPAAVLPEPPALEPVQEGATLELAALLGSPQVPTDLLGSTDESMPVVEFAGAKATNAKRIIYVVDASGSLVSWMQIVLNELFRSLEQLDERQQFAIIFFQEDRAIEVPPSRRLQKATSQARRRAIDWINEGDHVVPGYGSNPVTALEAAFDLHPDVIFLLSDSITGSGAYEVNQASLLASLEVMNPVRDVASGRRDVLIRCVQFLGEADDRLGTMRRIAELHGGVDGYKVYDREAMGLED